MRFMITANPGPGYDPAHAPVPDDKLFSTYMKFNEDLFQAGVLVASEGLSPASKTAQVGIKGGKRAMLDGPFAETKELVGGFWLIDVASRDEAIKWALRAPTGMGFDEILTIHQMTDLADIPPDFQAAIKKAAPGWFASVTKPR